MLALHAAGVDVVARPLKLNNNRAELPPLVEEFEKKHGGAFDAVIQNVLPHHADYCGKIPQNVVYYCTETSHFRGTNWADRINSMDVAWVCNPQSLLASRHSGVNPPIEVIPIACDITKYQRNYKTLSIRDRLGDSFIFYYIGEFNKRKNISTLLKAFHLEFDVNEPVHLVLKTNIGPGSGDEFKNIEAKEQIVSEINRVKEAMKLYSSLEYYKQEIVLTGRYTNEEIMRLHSSCDCFVCPSFGEAWCLPAFDAMALGKTPIVPNHTGFRSYMSDSCGWLVKSAPEPVFAMHNGTFDNLFTSREQWWGADVYDLMRCMREAYESGTNRQEKALSGKKRAYDFAHEKVGKQMVECLTK